MYNWRIRKWILVSGILSMLIVTACDSDNDLIGYKQKPDGYIPSSPIEFVKEEPVIAQ
ncbi:hypothetical protein [Shouchella lehensis]|uniref:hypothetical protein n=1 Tax=Shouchella lehensis TaxID=300825 RepID=UPI00141A5230|nr:hypothetical protein [Shouchella lehensis]